MVIKFIELGIKVFFIVVLIGGLVEKVIYFISKIIIVFKICVSLFISFEVDLKENIIIFNVLFIRVVIFKFKLNKI